MDNAGREQGGLVQGSGWQCLVRKPAQLAVFEAFRLATLEGFQSFEGLRPIGAEKTR